jgi:hypothetical protein
MLSGASDAARLDGKELENSGVAGFKGRSKWRWATDDRQDAYATLLTPRSSVTGAQSSIGFQPVFILAPELL